MARRRSIPARPDTPVTTGPVRTCVGCRKRAARGELLRVTAGPGEDGRPAVLPDPDGAAPGRGAHLHPTTACLELAVRRKAFGRALRVTTGLDDGPVAAHLAGTSRTSTTTTSTTEPTKDWSNSS